MQKQNHMQKYNHVQKQNSFLDMKSYIEAISNRIGGKTDEFKTKLRFDPSRLSSGILKKYLIDHLDKTEIEELFSGAAPEQYSKNPDHLSNYKVLKDLSYMSVKSWKDNLKKTGEIEDLYLNNDMMIKDSKYYYENWKIIQNEVGNHEKHISFFGPVSEIVRELSSRNYIDLSEEECGTMVSKDKMMEKKETKYDECDITAHSQQPQIQQFSQSHSKMMEYDFGVEYSLHEPIDKSQKQEEKENKEKQEQEQNVDCDSMGGLFFDDEEENNDLQMHNIL